MKKLISILLTLAFLPSLAAGMAFSTFADETYAEPAYLVDFTKNDNVIGCSGAYNLKTVHTEDGMKISFTDTGSGNCEDPYLSLALPANVDATKYHYFAMLLKTNKQDLHGELRFRTTTTGNDYPCQFFNYQKTNDWQLIVVDITNKNSVVYAAPATPFEGVFTNLRLDMFHNSCPKDTEYVIKAYGLYENLADAETFIHFTPEETDNGTQDTDKYADLWRGTDFVNPPLTMRMRWLNYGFKTTDPGPVDSLLTQGFGGVISNVLFQQDYLLNEEQFKVLGTVYEYANSLGMTTWIYDEYQWPSGRAFGQVLEGHDEYEATGIAHRIMEGKAGEKASFACTDPDIRIVRVDLEDKNGRRTLTAADGIGEKELTVTPEGDWKLHLYVLRFAFEGEEDRTDFRKLRDVDLLNKAAVARFIQLTHQRYKDKMGDSFADVDAFFTDEPHFGNRKFTGYAIWTPGLEEMFKEAYGYELDIAHIFEGDDDDAKRARMQYFSLVAKLFKESYIDQISAWCEANGVASSGHLLFEECMTDQIETYGGDFLQIIGGMTIPGLDLLWVDPSHLLSKNYIGNAIGTRYVASAAKNEGKDRVMVEYNPNAANALSKTDPLGDCIAGATITRLLGCTDYNVINPQRNLSPEQFRTLNTYVGRLNTLLDGAVECGELAVFYPIATVQSLYDADKGHTSETNKNSKAFRLDTDYQSLCLDLLTEQYLYTVLDDVALQKATVASDGCLLVGHGAYRAIILPFTRYISAKAMETLVTFQEAGGTVIFVGDTPAYGLVAEEDGQVAEAMSKLADAPAFKRADSKFFDELAEYVSCRVNVTTEQTKQQKSMLVGDFATADRDIVYFGNTADKACKFTATYTDGYTGKVTVYFPGSGVIEMAEAKAGVITLTVPAGEAVLAVREDAKGLAHLEGHTPYEAEKPVESSEETTELATEPTTADETDAAEITAPADTDKTAGGCASTLGFSAIVTASLAAAGTAAFRKKKK